MAQKQSRRSQGCILIGLLALWLCQIGVVCTESDFDRDIQPPFENSGVGSRQSAYRRLLHDQLERLTHAELKKDENSIAHHRTHRGNEKEHHEEVYSNSREKYEHHDTENSRYYEGDGEDHTDAAQSAEEEEERSYNPWNDSFQDIFEDGTYAYGYNLPNGVTRFERSFYSDEYKGRVVEGFYTQPRHFGKGILYELRCYRSDYFNGYKQFGVQYLKRQPFVERDTEPNVDCFDKH